MADTCAPDLIVEANVPAGLYKLSVLAVPPELRILTLPVALTALLVVPPVAATLNPVAIPEPVAFAFIVRPVALAFDPAPVEVMIPPAALAFGADALYETLNKLLVRLFDVLWVSVTSYCMNDPFDQAGDPPEMMSTCPSVVGEGVQFSIPVALV